MTINTIKNSVVICLIVAAVIGLFFIAPIPQDPSYHIFADQRLFFGIPNFFNVSSNILFVVFGFWGLILLVFKTQIGGLRSLKKVYIALFLGILLTGFGSSYYHLNPNNLTLVWDRLPMTIAFMALFTMVIGEQFDEELALTLFGPLLVFGIFSIAYWHFTELKGIGDLRIYILVQFLPIILIPIFLLFYSSPFSSTAPIWFAIVFYVLAKTFEIYDYGFFNFKFGISGHSLKHIFAALGCGCLVLALRDRRLLKT